MLIRNISGSSFDLVGVTISDNEVILIDELGTRDQIRLNANDIITAVTSNNIQFEYTDGYVQSDITKLYNLLQNGYTEVQVTNKVEVEQKLNNYYFLKDTFKIKKDEIIEKEFRGRLKSLAIKPNDRDIDVVIVTGDGLILPAENLTKHQTMEFEFGGDIKDPIIRFIGTGTNEIDIFLEGFNNEVSLSDLQRFVNTWYEDHTSWSTAKIVVSTNRNYRGVDYSTTNDVINGNKITINDDKSNGTYTYKIYKVKPNDYKVELLYNGYWGSWSDARFSLRVKNVRHFEFNDTSIDVTIDTIASDSEHDNDRDDD